MTSHCIASQLIRRLRIRDSFARSMQAGYNSTTATAYHSTLANKLRLERDDLTGPATRLGRKDSFMAQKGFPCRDAQELLFPFPDSAYECPHQTHVTASVSAVDEAILRKVGLGVEDAGLGWVAKDGDPERIRVADDLAMRTAVVSRHHQLCACLFLM